MIVWGLGILLDTSTPFPKVKDFLLLDGRFFDASEDHGYFEAMDLEGQQILSEGFQCGHIHDYMGTKHAKI